MVQSCSLGGHSIVWSPTGQPPTSCSLIQVTSVLPRRRQSSWPEMYDLGFRPPWRYGCEHSKVVLAQDQVRVFWARGPLRPAACLPISPACLPCQKLGLTFSPTSTTGAQGTSLGGQGASATGMLHGLGQLPTLKTPTPGRVQVLTLVFTLVPYPLSELGQSRAPKHFELLNVPRSSIGARLGEGLPSWGVRPSASHSQPVHENEHHPACGIGHLVD